MLSEPGFHLNIKPLCLMNGEKSHIYETLYCIITNNMLSECAGNVSAVLIDLFLL